MIKAVLDDTAPAEWWCDCPDRKGPHVHMPNWDASSRYGLMVTALVDTATGLEVPGTRC